MKASPESLLSQAIHKALNALYGLSEAAVELQATRKEFEGDYTLVVFPYLRHSRKKPEETASEIGAYLQSQLPALAGFNVVKGFLNLRLSDAFWLDQFATVQEEENFGHQPQGEELILVEYSSPNTNKPLHLGHIRNNLLGYSVAQILAAAGKKVRCVQIINDRGIHICKSMLAWQKFGEGERPETHGLKGDHLVGKYYVAFDKAYKAEIKELMAQGRSEEQASEEAPLLQEARAMLRRWEEGDPETVALWEKMNAWVYTGFEATYQRLGVHFDRNYYESQTYLLGKEWVEKGLAEGHFFRKEDGSVWCDLSEEKLGEKLLLRRDGTSVYMTQDLGTAIQRYEDFGLQGMIYTVGNEQDHHFKVLFAILKKLGFPWAERLFHLSYGMVDLPSGKMKSREGTVVDADELMDQMAATAQKISEELGKTESLPAAEKQALYEMVGQGALKYFILRVDPRKRMLFNPEESIDFQGNTGPFIQYTHARIRSLLRKAQQMGLAAVLPSGLTLAPQERALLQHQLNFPAAIKEAAAEYSPALIAQYAYDLVKLYNALYQQLPILNDPDPERVALRLKLSEMTARLSKAALALLGIAVPNRM